MTMLRDNIEKRKTPEQINSTYTKPPQKKIYMQGK